MNDRLRPVLDDIRPLADLFAAAGKRVYLVGGLVRDLLAGLAIERPECALTTDGGPVETERIIGEWADAVWSQGGRFGRIGAKHGERDYEITTHRAEAYHPDSRKPEVVYADAIE